LLNIVAFSFVRLTRSYNKYVMTGCNPSLGYITKNKYYRYWCIIP